MACSSAVGKADGELGSMYGRRMVAAGKCELCFADKDWCLLSEVRLRLA
jgi:hypothetical protein